MPRVETAVSAFSSAWGNTPGVVHLLGCGDAKYEEDLGWIAWELTDRNFITFVAGCAAIEVARHFNEKTQKYIFEEFGAENNLRNIINTGDCAACVHILDQAMKWPRTEAGTSHYGNYAETADIYGNILSAPLLVWGALPDRMYAIVAAWARGGCPVVVGPESAFDWNRFLVGNKWDWKRWWYYDGWARKKRPVEPAPKHMIFPVETREEAVTAVTIMNQRPASIRDFRLIGLETYIEFSQEAFGEWPDDWHLYARSAWELPLRHKTKMLRELAEKQGWEVERLNIKRAKLPDGRLVDMETFQNEFGCMGGVYPTRLPRLFPDTELRNYKTSYEIGVGDKKS
jgi:CO dehydrogenase/acetyl-CoA synthase alpha subunit